MAQCGQKGERRISKFKVTTEAKHGGDECNFEDGEFIVEECDGVCNKKHCEYKYIPSGNNKCYTNLANKTECGREWWDVSCQKIEKILQITQEAQDGGDECPKKKEEIVDTTCPKDCKIEWENVKVTHYGKKKDVCYNNDGKWTKLKEARVTQYQDPGGACPFKGGQRVWFSTNKNDCKGHKHDTNVGSRNARQSFYNSAYKDVKIANKDTGLIVVNDTDKIYTEADRIASIKAESSR